VVREGGTMGNTKTVATVLAALLAIVILIAVLLPLFMTVAIRFAEFWDRLL
jgi:hypothetical protein